MNLKIYSPEKILFEDKVSSVKFPGIDGTFQVLENHAPLISALKQGSIVIQEDNSNKEIPIKGGFVEVLYNELSALVEE
tara:strand:- start:390 stop:626 length:237 start_codon:yes stop_codon:yes gene_type:complete